MAKRHMKRYLTSLIIKETKIKTTMRSHLTPVRMGKINKAGNHKCWRGCWRKGNPLALLVGMWTGAATLENCVAVPQRVKNRPALWPSNCTVGDLPQRYKCNKMSGHLHPDVYSSNVHNSQTVEGASVSTDRWIKKLWSMYAMKYSSAIRNDKYPPFASTWMELEGIMLSEISQ